MELFVKGEEVPLDDERRLISAEKVPLFMLPKEVSYRTGPVPLMSARGAAQERDGKGCSLRALRNGHHTGGEVLCVGRVRDCAAQSRD
jgi:hypothetical protein